MNKLLARIIEVYYLVNESCILGLGTVISWSLFWRANSRNSHVKIRYSFIYDNTLGWKELKQSIYLTLQETGDTLLCGWIYKHVKYITVYPVSKTFFYYLKIREKFALDAYLWSKSGQNQVKIWSKSSLYKCLFTKYASYRIIHKLYHIKYNIIIFHTMYNNIY